jgi:hypothetical protein
MRMRIFLANWVVFDDFRLTELAEVGESRAVTLKHLIFIISQVETII